MSVNIGGTWTKYSIANEEGIIINKKEKTILSGSSQSIPKRIIEIFDIFIRDRSIYNVNMIKIGVSFAGLIINSKGIASNICGGITKNNTIPNDWLSVPFDILYEHFNIVSLRNDVISETILEHNFGVLKRYKHCAYVNWGTGIGCGIFSDNKIIEGKRGFAGHAGHQFVSNDTKHQCGCGNFGDLESIIGSSAVLQKYNMPLQELLFRANSGEKKSIKISNYLIKNISKGLFNLLVILDLEAICMGGGIFFSQPDYIINKIKSNMAEFSSLFVNDIKILHSLLHEKNQYLSGFCEIVPQKKLENWVKNFNNV